MTQERYSLIQALPLVLYFSHFVICDQITVYDDFNYGGASRRVTYTRCVNLLDDNYFNDQASSVRITPNVCMKMYEHACCQGRSIEIRQDAPDLRSYNFDNTATSVSPCGDFRSVSPDILVEKWLGHNQTIHKVFDNNVDLTIYYNDGINPSITWPFEYMPKVWAYVKRIYGDFGPENHINGIFHGSVPRSQYGFNSINNYFDLSSDCRNLADYVSETRDGWSSNTGDNIDVVTHEFCHIVEGASKGVHGSPTYGFWMDSKWAEIFQYDVYKALGLTTEMNRWYNKMQGQRDGFPRQNTAWFKDWFYPIYSKYGGAALLNKYFELLAKYWPRATNGNTFDYDGSTINMGEFVHFYSGAAGTNLKDQATIAFSWNSDYESQFQAAKKKYPGITYSASAGSASTPFPCRKRKRPSSVAGSPIRSNQTISNHSFIQVIKA